jgi:signal transduction histidine kinase
MKRATMTLKQTKTVLIVDDNPANLETLGDWLYNTYRVLAATSGEAGLSVAGRTTVDIVLLDIMMPGMDGYEILRRLRANPRTRDIPVLFVTALDCDEDEELGLRLGAADYITKPLKPAVVLARIDTQLALSEARRRLEEQNERLEETVAKRTADLEKAKSEAEAANRAKSAFLAAISHELRTPLNGVLGFAELLELANDLSDEHKRYVSHIRKSGKHLLTMVQDIIDLADLGIGAIDINSEPCQTESCFDEVIAHFREVANQRGLRFSVSNAIPLAIEVDVRRVRRILSHILDNAFKFTEQGEVQLDISLENRTLRIVVKDDGPGIPPERLERIFFPFQHDPATVYTRKGGSGIGLSLCKTLVDFLGGAIDISSEAGVGTHVLIRIPIKSVDGCCS